MSRVTRWSRRGAGALRKRHSERTSLEPRLRPGAGPVGARLGPPALLAALLLVACGDAGDEAGGAREPAAAADVPADTTVEPGDGPVATSPWVRMAIVPEGSDAPDAPPVNSAAYLVLTNPLDIADALVAVETEVADTAEIHSVTMDDGVMRMRPVDAVEVPAGGEAVLEPGGYHIMLIGLTGPLTEGDSVDLRLRLRSGAVIDVTAPVFRSPPQL